MNSNNCNLNQNQNQIYNNSIIFYGNEGSYSSVNSSNSQGFAGFNPQPIFSAFPPPPIPAPLSQVPQSPYNIVIYSSSNNPTGFNPQPYFPVPPQFSYTPISQAPQQSPYYTVSHPLQTVCPTFPSVKEPANITVNEKHKISYLIDEAVDKSNDSSSSNQSFDENQLPSNIATLTARFLENSFVCDVVHNVVFDPVQIPSSFSSSSSSSKKKIKLNKTTSKRSAPRANRNEKTTKVSCSQLYKSVLSDIHRKMTEANENGEPFKIEDYLNNRGFATTEREKEDILRKTYFFED